MSSSSSEGSQSSSEDSTSLEPEAEGNWEVQEILEVRLVNGLREYKVKWKDCGKDKWSDDKHDSWLEAANMDCPDLLAAFKEKQKRKKHDERRSRSASTKRKSESKAQKKQRRSAVKDEDEEKSDDDAPRKTERRRKRVVIDSDDDDVPSRSTSRSRSKTTESKDEDSRGASTSRSSSRRPSLDPPSSSTFVVPSIPKVKTPKSEKRKGKDSSQKKTRSASKETKSKEESPRVEKGKKERSSSSSSKREGSTREVETASPLVEKVKEERRSPSSTKTADATIGEGNEVEQAEEAVETPAAEEQRNFILNPTGGNGYDDGYKGTVVDHCCITSEDGTEVELFEVSFAELHPTQLIPQDEVKRRDPEEYGRYMMKLAEKKRREVIRQGAANYRAVVAARKEKEAKEQAERGE